VTEQRPVAWIFVVDPGEADLEDAFADGEAVVQFEVDEAQAAGLQPGRPAHLWLRGSGVRPGLYATGAVVGPPVPGDDGAVLVPVGFESLRRPVDADVLLADPAFAASPLAGGDDDVVPLDAAQAAAVGAHDLDPGPLPPLEGIEDGVPLPALEVRLPDDTFLVVDGIGHDGWTVIRGDPDMTEVVELPEQHRTFIDAVEYVATVVGRAGGALPVVDVDEGLEAVAVFDADGGLYAVFKESEDAYTFAWVDDDGTLERIDRYATLKEAILLPVLDEELFGDR